jgi:putative tricarboxylic transport membrane protein
MSITKRTLLTGACAALVALSPMAAIAQDWEPRRPIDFTIMAGPGGGADQIARFIQSVAEQVRHDQPAAGAQQPRRRLRRRGADPRQQRVRPDHTILVTLNSFFTTPLRQENLGIDIQTFTPVAMMGVDPFVLWVHTDSASPISSSSSRGEGSMDGEFVMGGTGTGQEDSIVIAFMSGRLRPRHQLHPL